jgi:hypothetical protein
MSPAVFAMDKYIHNIALLIAAIAPFFIVRRWWGLGFIFSVLGGWGLVFVASAYADPAMFKGDEAQINPIFTGVWACFGWAFMLIWSSFAFVFSFCIAIARNIVADAIDERRANQS